MSWYLGVFIFLVGCATSTKETMMSDGKTWKVTVKSASNCNGLMRDNQCLEDTMPDVEARAEELCGGEPKRIFACSRNYLKVECMAECN